MALTTDQKFAIDFNVHEITVNANILIPPAAEALIYGVSEADLATYQIQVDAQNAATAREIAAMPQAAAFLARFSAGQSVLFLGDSITTYRYSYARVLRHLLEPRGVTVINRAYSGYTSLHGVELTYTQCLDAQPDHVFIKYGVNDSKRFGAPDSPLFVSESEYLSHLRMIVRGFQHNTSARITMLTPTQLVEPIVAADANIRALRIHWFNRDLRARGDIIAQIAAEMSVEWVDLRGCLGDPPDAALYCPDGLHPNIEGEKRMLIGILGRAQ
ncbi:MAG: SGNH/GDSL hydrolase family protein [Chloroflexota bacterium]|nr:SGNH/GDSL hydrolase family protein [Chloroflexota bacterium]